MELKQEIKSLPRNRKCGNCRYFEPAPLWRKGWCRNSRLYDTRANHLVDAATLDCEQIFRARLYWEPIPVEDTLEATTPIARISPNSAADSGAGDSGYAGYGRPVADGGVLRAKTTTINPPVATNPANQPQNLPVINRSVVPVAVREKAGAGPGMVARPNRLHGWMMENIPYYDKASEMLRRLEIMRFAPWVLVALVPVIIVVMLTNGNKGAATNATPTGVAGNATVGAAPRPTTGSMSSALASAGAAKPTLAPNQGGATQALPTATLSTLVPTATAQPQPAATVKSAETFAKIVNAPNGLKMRKDPTNQVDTNVLRTIPQGKLVKIRSGDFRTADGLTWWPISFEGQDGWAAANYLEEVKNP